MQTLVPRTALVLAVLSPLAGPVSAADQADELMPGRVAVVRNRGGSVGLLAKFVAKPPAGSVFELPNASNDPRAEGAALRVLDTGGGAGDDTYGLPAQVPPLGWRALGSPPGSRGFRYRGAGTVADPCRTVVIKPRVVKALCRRESATQSGVTLSPPFTGDLAVVLTVGTDSKRYCARFGGAERKNGVTPGGVGVTVRRGAPAPGACASPSGAYLEPPGLSLF